MMMSERDQHPPEKKTKNRLPVFRDGGEFVFCFFCFIFFSRKAQADETRPHHQHFEESAECEREQKKSSAI